MSEPSVTRAEQVEVVDLSDLDLLDDDKRHGCCVTCYPSIKLGVPFTTMCGKRSIWLYGLDRNEAPPNACVACVQVIYGPCPKGHRSC